MLSTHSPQGASSLYALHLPRKHPAASTELPECGRFASALPAGRSHGSPHLQVQNTRPVDSPAQRRGKLPASTFCRRLCW